jgi:hypothetical protein
MDLMALKIVHRFISEKADGPDSTLAKPSDWNDTHDVETDGAGGMVVGRDTSGPGPLQELPLAYSAVGAIGRWIANVVGSFGLPSGSSGQRPAAPQPGEIRFNTDISLPEVFIGGAWQPLLVGGSPMFTGLIMGWYPATPPAGWLLLNGDTFGDASSGATHADNMYQSLYTHVWNLPILMPVTGGRGPDATTDWGNHKPIQLMDERGTVAAMGEAASNFLPGDTTKTGTLVGAGGTTQTAHMVIGGTTDGNAPGGNLGIVGSGPAVGNHTHTFTVTGDTQAFPVVQKTIIRNAIIKI